MHWVKLTLLLLSVPYANGQLLSYFLSGVPHIFKQLTNPLIGRVPPASPAVQSGDTSLSSVQSSLNLSPAGNPNGADFYGVDHWLQENQALAKHFPYTQIDPVTEPPVDYFQIPERIPQEDPRFLPQSPPPENLQNSAIAFPDYTDPAGFPPGLFDVTTSEDIPIPVVNAPPESYSGSERREIVPPAGNDAAYRQPNNDYPNFYSKSEEEITLNSPEVDEKLSFSQEIKNLLREENQLSVPYEVDADDDEREEGWDPVDQSSKPNPFGNPYLNDPENRFNFEEPEIFLPNSGLTASKYQEVDRNPQFDVHQSNLVNAGSNFPSFGSFSAGSVLSHDFAKNQPPTEENNYNKADSGVLREDPDLTPDALLVLEELDKIYAESKVKNDSHLNLVSSGLSIRGSPITQNFIPTVNLSNQSVPDFSRFQATEKPFISKLLESLTSGLQSLIPNEKVKQALQAAVANRQQVLAKLAAGNLRHRNSGLAALRNRLRKSRFPARPQWNNIAAHAPTTADNNIEAGDLRAYPRRWQRRLQRAQTRQGRQQTLIDPVQPIITSDAGLPANNLLQQLNALQQLQRPLDTVANTGDADQLITNVEAPSFPLNFPPNEEEITLSPYTDSRSAQYPALGASPSQFHNKPRPPPQPFEQEPRTSINLSSEIGQPIYYNPSSELIANERDKGYIADDSVEGSNSLDGLLVAAAKQDPILDELYRKHKDLFTTNRELPDKKTTDFLYRQLAEIGPQEPVPIDGGRIQLIRPPFGGPFLEESDLEESEEISPPYQPEPVQNSGEKAELTPELSSKILNLALAHFDQDAKHGPKSAGNNFFANSDLTGPSLSLNSLTNVPPPPPGTSNNLAPDSDYPSFSDLSQLLHRNPELASREGLKFIAPTPPPPPPPPPRNSRDDLLERLLSEGIDEPGERQLHEEPQAPLRIRASDLTTAAPSRSRFRSVTASTDQLPRFRKGGRANRLKWLNGLAGIVSPHHHPHPSQQQLQSTTIRPAAERPKTRNYRTVKNKIRR